jgi:hypothetical protein
MCMASPQETGKNDNSRGNHLRFWIVARVTRKSEVNCRYQAISLKFRLLPVQFTSEALEIGSEISLMAIVRQPYATGCYAGHQKIRRETALAPRQSRKTAPINLKPAFTAFWPSSVSKI